MKDNAELLSLLTLEKDLILSTSSEELTKLVDGKTGKAVDVVRSAKRFDCSNMVELCSAIN